MYPKGSTERSLGRKRPRAPKDNQPAGGDLPILRTASRIGREEPEPNVDSAPPKENQPAGGNLSPTPNIPVAQTLQGLAGRTSKMAIDQAQWLQPITDTDLHFLKGKPKGSPIGNQLPTIPGYCSKHTLNATDPNGAARPHKPEGKRTVEPPVEQR